MSTATFIAEILRYFTGFLMLAAASGKLRTFGQFRDNLSTSFGVKPSLARVLAPAVVAAECGAAVLVLGGATRLGMLASLLMLGGFTAVVGYKFYTESVVKCSCFGEAARSVSGFDLLRNLLVIAAIGAYLVLAAGAALPLPAAMLAAALATILLVAATEFHDISTLLVPA